MVASEKSTVSCALESDRVAALAAAKNKENFIEVCGKTEEGTCNRP